MRFSNVVIGFFLAVAVAYIHDASMSAVTPDGRPQNLVNWPVLEHVIEDAGGWVREQLRMR